MTFIIMFLDFMDDDDVGGVDDISISKIAFTHAMPKGWLTTNTLGLTCHPGSNSNFDDDDDVGVNVNVNGQCQCRVLKFMHDHKFQKCHDRKCVHTVLQLKVKKTFANKNQKTTVRSILTYLMCKSFGYKYQAREFYCAKLKADIKTFFYKKTYISKSIINLQITIQRWGLLNMKRCWLSKKHPSQVNWLVSTVLKNVLLKKERRENLCYPARLCKIKCRNMQHV